MTATGRRAETTALRAAARGRLGAEPEGSEAITKTFTFADFSEAFGWMARVALAPRRWNHHPEWRNVYKTVEVMLSPIRPAG